MDDYIIHLTMTLADIGLTEENENYYIFIEADGDKNVKGLDEEWSPDNSILIYFLVKDKNTIIAFQGSWCIEYKRCLIKGEMKDLP